MTGKMEKSVRQSSRENQGPYYMRICTLWQGVKIFILKAAGNHCPVKARVS